MKTRALWITAACFGLAAPVVAQPPPPNPPNNRPQPSQDSNENTKAQKGFWQATLPGGNYLVATDRVTSVSRHSYLLDGALVVDEVTIDTVGQAIARFYFISPVGAGTPANTAGVIIERGKGLLDAAGQRAGVDLENMVIKKYPETTHARTIEYRLPSETQLTALFNSAKQAWQSGTGGQFTVQMK